MSQTSGFALREVLGARDSKACVPEYNPDARLVTNDCLLLRPSKRSSSLQVRV